MLSLGGERIPLPYMHTYTHTHTYQPMMISLGGERIPAPGIPGEMDAIVSNLGTLRFRCASPFPRDQFSATHVNFKFFCPT